jgi:hypothetical protein
MAVGLVTLVTLKKGREKGNEKTTVTTDRRRYGVIEVRRVNAETYHLTIGGRLWSEVEWSRSRRAWCVQDAAGHCLTHVESIVGQDRDPQAAIALAKRMIIDGRMPSPEVALHQLRQRNEQRTTRPRAKTRTKKPVKRPAKKPEPLGELITGDITARSEAMPVNRVNRESESVK